jgi:ribosomal protein L11 methyltransferase
LAENLWQIAITAQKPVLEDIEQQQQDGLNPPLSLSLFEDELPLWRLELVMDSEPGSAMLEMLQRPHAQVKIEKLADKNWVMESLRFLTPVHAGRFFVHGSHDDAPDNDATIPICIPAGMAFGTGHHETTSGCLLEYDQMLCDGEQFTNIVDVGTGAGILAIAAAKTSQAAILATDIDPIAIDVAIDNAHANEQASDIQFLVIDGVDPAKMPTGNYDLVFANILAGPLIDMAAEIAALLQPKGRLILAGLLNEQANQVETAYVERGLEMIRSRQLGDWTILVLGK